MIKRIIKDYSNDIRNYLIGMGIYFTIDLSMLVFLIYVLVSILPQPPSIRYKIIYLISLIMFLFVYRYAQKKGVDIAESFLCDVRERIIEDIRNCDLQSFEKIDKSGGYNAITLETQIIAESIEKVLYLTENIWFITNSIIIILIISPISSLLVIVIFFCTGFIYTYYILKAKKVFHEARKKERELFDATCDVIEGFKYLKLNDKKNDDFYHHCLKVKSADNRQLKIEAENLLLTSNVYSLMFEFGVFLPIVFLLPYMGLIKPDVLMATIMLILFMSVTNIKSIIPFLVRTGVSIERLIILEKALNQYHKETLITIPTKKIHTFKEIKYDNISFKYSDQNDHSTFSLENISFSIFPEEVLFISGG